MVFIDRFGSKFFYYRGKTDYGFNEPSLETPNEIIFTQDMELYNDYQNRNLNVYFNFMSDNYMIKDNPIFKIKFF